MQRIDQNTYIDDTLVTCAEYQLFIDEMREQGKYYQPDHWISYQFSEGQGRKPILGVRHSDALAFCGWVTNREDDGWRYRLPTQQDGLNFPIKYDGKSSLCYWVDGKYQFVWVGAVENDVRGISSAIVLDLNNADALNFAREFARDFAHTRDYARALDIDLACDRALDIDHSIVLSLSRTRKIDFDFDLGVDLAWARARALEIALNLARAHESHLELALDLYIDIFTLHERIAGRSPAFEGIRLVRERTR